MIPYREACYTCLADDLASIDKHLLRFGRSILWLMHVRRGWKDDFLICGHAPWTATTCRSFRRWPRSINSFESEEFLVGRVGLQDAELWSVLLHVFKHTRWQRFA